MVITLTLEGEFDENHHPSHVLDMPISEKDLQENSKELIKQ